MLKIAVNTSQGVGAVPKTRETYIRALYKSGYDPVIVGPDDDLSLLHDIKGVILIGGPDIPPEFYGGRCHHTISPQEAHKIDQDYRLIHLSVKRQIPLLGICAGMQTLGCYFGGKMFPHMPEGGGHIQHQRSDGGRHGLKGVSNKLAQVLGTNDPSVNTRHHQCVSHPGELQIDAYSPDGYIEAISHRKHPILGVQWHPEDLVDERPYRRLFHHLVRGFK